MWRLTLPGLQAAKGRAWPLGVATRSSSETSFPGAGMTRSERSSLYVLSSRRVKTNVIVMPQMDMWQATSDERFAQSIRARKIGMSEGDLGEMKTTANYYKWFVEEVEEKKSQGTDLQAQISVLVERSKTQDLDEDDAKRLIELKAQKKEVNKKVKDLVASKEELEEMLVYRFLDSPNRLHEKCPLTEDRVISSFFDKPSFDFQVKSHLELAGDSLEFRDDISSSAYFLFGPLADLELRLCQRLQSHLMSSGASATSFNLISCPDFTKSLVLEGCGVDFCDPRKEFTMREAHDAKGFGTGRAMHLVGGSSLYPFVAFFCKNLVIRPSVLPQAYVNIGRRYQPVNFDNSARDLFNTQQSTSAFLFNVGQGTDTDLQFQSLLATMKEFYEKLGIHFRTVERCAPTLESAEMYRVSFEMWAPSRGDYIEVGHLSDFGDFLSKRMMLKSQDEQKNLQDLHVIAGEVLNVPKVIGCTVECSQDASGWKSGGT